MTRRAFLKSLFLSVGALAAGSRLRALGGSPGPRYDPDAGSSATPPGTPTGWRPAYVDLEERGEFRKRVDEAYRMYSSCSLCPRRCGVNRLQGERGYCRVPGATAVVHSRSPHYGEELPLVGTGGSGTIFFSHCNLRCVFCQNWPIAHEGRGRQVTDEELAGIMLELQRIGCHNINVVTPSHMMPNILAATRIAMLNGLRLPLCYNTGGYDAIEAIRLLDGIVDIYLPDLKFMGGSEAERYTGGARDYPETARQAIVEMHRQVGELVTDDRGIALRGLMIRHLVMPNHVAGTREFVRWVAGTLTPSTYVNIMSQYRVEHRAFDHPTIARAITVTEFNEAMQWAADAGLTNLDQRSVMQWDVFRRRQ